MSPLEEKIKTLPPKLQQEVEQFVNQLMDQANQKPAHTLKQDWAGILKPYKHEFSALELQKKALEWRTQ